MKSPLVRHIILNSLVVVRHIILNVFIRKHLSYDKYLRVICIFLQYMNRKK